MKQKIKILLADDEILFRKGISFLLQREENIEIVFEASDGSELIEYLYNNTNHPNVILMDLKMPIINGVEATKQIHNDYPDIKIIALSSYNSKMFVDNMLQVGAVSYLIKTATPTQMIETINEVYRKGYHYNKQAITEIFESAKNIKTKSFLDDDFLSTREREILVLICQQYSTSEIAEKLFLSPRTVDAHRNNLLLKTQAKNVAGLVVFAIQNNVIKMSDLQSNLDI
jgi:DNA-binding NarL/FixJ family response regulator